MTKTADRYAYWRAALAGMKPEANPDNPQAGYYRMRKHKDGPFVPVAVWFGEADQMYCLIDGRMVDENTARARWSYFADKPITHEVYTAVAYCDENWPDIDETVADQQRQRIGGNNPPEDEALILREQIDAACAGASQYAKIEDEATLAKAQSLRARLNELSRTADTLREKEKRPHMEAAKAVDARFMPLVKKSKDAANSIARAMSAFVDAQARKAEEAAREAARKAAEENKPEPTPAPAPVAAAPTTVKGAYGRAASVKVVRVAVVTDQDAVYRYMRERPEVAELLAKLAQRAVDAGNEVPGVKVEERRKVA